MKTKFKPWVIITAWVVGLAAYVFALPPIFWLFGKWSSYWFR